MLSIAFTYFMVSPFASLWASTNLSVCFRPQNWAIQAHTSLETWFWFQWTLTIPYDQGWWEHWFKLYLRWFHCKNLDLYFSTDFKRVLWKYKISSYTTTFYLIFWFFGTFYDDQSHFCDLKVQFSTQNI